MRVGNSRGGERGFTLLEVMVALAIVALVVTSYLGIRTNAVAEAIEARNWRLAREIAEEKMSELQAGAREIPPQSGEEVPMEKTPGFSYKILIGELAIGELESKAASDAAEENKEAGDRDQWQLDRDHYRKAAAEGKSFSDYDQQLKDQDYQRTMEEKVPDENQFEDVAVAVFFPKVNATQPGQKETFVLKAKASTLAISGLTPDQAKVRADAQGQGSGSGDNASGGGSGSSGSGSGSGGGSGSSGSGSKSSAGSAGKED
jgi:type II secretion system protein I